MSLNKRNKMKYILVFDIGNTNIVGGVYEDGLLKCTLRLSSDLKKTADEYFVLVNSICENQGVNINCMDKIVLSSVVPSLTRCFEHMFQRYFKCGYIIVNGYSQLGLTYSVNDPGFIGADLIVNAYSAWKKYQTNCIICDMGTATTIQLVSQEGHFWGTSILPGLVTGAVNLFEKAALLSDIQLEKPTKILGTTTKEALLSGIVYGHAFLLDRFITEIKATYFQIENIKTIATGGISALVCEHTQNVDVIDKTLTLDGLYLIAVNDIN